MKHTNNILKDILREEYHEDYDENNWHYDNEYKMLREAFYAGKRKSWEELKDWVGKKLDKMSTHPPSNIEQVISLRVGIYRILKEINVLTNTKINRIDKN